MRRIRDFFSAVRFLMTESHHSRKFREILMGYDRVIGKHQVNPYRKHLEMFDLVRSLEIDKEKQDKLIELSGMLLRLDIDDGEWVFYPKEDPLDQPDCIAASAMLVEITDCEQKWRIDICNATDYDDWGKVRVEVPKNANSGIGKVYQKAIERREKGVEETPYNPSNP